MSAHWYIEDQQISIASIKKKIRPVVVVYALRQRLADPGLYNMFQTWFLKKFNL